MDNKASPGCVKTASNRYRPLIIVAERGIYFNEYTFPSVELAFARAELAVETDDFGMWHFHSTEP